MTDQSNTHPFPFDAVVFDIGGTLVQEAAPGTPVDRLAVTYLDGAPRMLAALAAAGLALGAVTDTSVMTEADVRSLLAAEGVTDLLTALVTSVDIGAAKPDPAGISEVLRRLDLTDPARVLFVGDRDVDLHAATAAGCGFAEVSEEVPVTQAVYQAFAAAGASPLAAATAVGTTPEKLTVDVAHFRAKGWLLTRTLTDRDAVAQLQAWVNEVAEWPDADGEWMHHRELTDEGPRLCRSENIIPFHGGLRELLTAGSMLATASALLGEPAVLYKEKINYKLAGGAGYAPHQDAPAYPFIDNHVSCMIAVDDSTLANGCLEVVEAMHHEVLPVDDAGCVRPDLVAGYDWVPVEVPAGSTLWFHSRTPHRSGPNTSMVPRRALYPTYNALAEGDLRADYYREKVARFAAGTGRADGKVQVSLIDDFEGRAV